MTVDLVKLLVGAIIDDDYEKIYNLFFRGTHETEQNFATINWLAIIYTFRHKNNIWTDLFVPYINCHSYKFEWLDHLIALSAISYDDATIYIEYLPPDKLREFLAKYHKRLSKTTIAIIKNSIISDDCMKVVNEFFPS